MKLKKPTKSLSLKKKTPVKPKVHKPDNGLECYLCGGEKTPEENICGWCERKESIYRTEHEDAPTAPDEFDEVEEDEDEYE